jgi:uncharacterized membrane protein
MEGFSDGVFGFAITLLVVDIALHPPGTPLQQALHAWPAYLAYITSFLLVVVFLPFPTRLMGFTPVSRCTW